MILRQRTRADRRAEWWRRAQWAIDWATQEDQTPAAQTRKVVGLEVLNVLAVSELAYTEELRTLEVIIGRALPLASEPAADDHKTQTPPASRMGSPDDQPRHPQRHGNPRTSARRSRLRPVDDHRHQPPTQSGRNRRRPTEDHRGPAPRPGDTPVGSPGRRGSHPVRGLTRPSPYG